MPRVVSGALNGVTVTDGLFVVELDFGAVFDGTELWLEIEVGGSTLGSRQNLTPTPFALYAAAGPSSLSPHMVWVDQVSGTAVGPMVFDTINGAVTAAAAMIPGVSDVTVFIKPGTYSAASEGGAITLLDDVHLRATTESLTYQVILTTNLIYAGSGRTSSAGGDRRAQGCRQRPRDHGQRRHGYHDRKHYDRSLTRLPGANDAFRRRLPIRDRSH